MNSWEEEDFLKVNTWYHGTTAYGLEHILKVGVDAKYNKKRTPLDFGYGFYLCPTYEWSLNYAKALLELTDDDLDVKSNEGYVVEYEFVPIKYAKDNYKFFSGMDETFAKFVFDNRIKYKYHILTGCVHSYDFVCGPMSDGNQINDFNDYKLNRISKGELLERLMQPKEDWQLLLHKQYLCDELKIKAIYNLKGERCDDYFKKKYDKK